MVLRCGWTQAGPVVAHHADHRVVPLRAGVGVEHMVKAFRRDLGQQRRQPKYWPTLRVGGLEEGVVIGQLVHLAGGGLASSLRP